MDKEPDSAEFLECREKRRISRNRGKPTALVRMYLRWS